MTRDLMYREEVRDLVRDAYAGLDAPSGPARHLYHERQLAAVPEEARRWALGVGNPVRHAGLSTGETVIDLGCGAGVDVFLAAEKVGPAGTVIGVDFLESMVATGRRLAAESGHDNVSFFEAEIDDLPMGDGIADVVISNGAINLAARKSRVLAEARRVLRPGGRLCVADLTIDENELPTEILVHPSAWAG